MKLLVVLLITLLIVALPSPTAAQGPTATPTPRPPTATPIPEQLHSRASILTRIAPREIGPINPLPGNWDTTNQAGVDVAAEGGGWFRTIFNLLNQSTFGVYLSGFIMMFIVAGAILFLIVYVKVAK